MRMSSGSEPARSFARMNGIIGAPLAQRALQLLDEDVDVAEPIDRALAIAIAASS